MKTNTKQPRSISRFVSQVLPEPDDPPVDEATRQSLELCWREQIGDAAYHGRPYLFQSGRLVIYCESPVWLTQLRNQAPSILLQLVELGIPVSEIKIKIQPVSTNREPATGPPRMANPVSEESVRSILKTSEGLKHPGLESSLKKLGARIRDTNKKSDPD